MANAADLHQKPFIEHIHELKLRALWCVSAIVLGSGVGYFLNEQLLHILQKPLGQTLFYTSPAGGFSFIIKLSLFFGLIVALPIVMYQLVQFLGPLMRKLKRRTIFAYMLWSILLAAAGICFAYFISLPAALHFLTNFGSKEIQSLITADSYFNFAITYLGGFALLFQVPLIMLFINRIKPLTPSKLMHGQRYVVLGSTIVAAVLTPTPDPLNQLIMALPIILLYQVSIILLWVVNRRRQVQVEPLPIEETPQIVQPQAPPRPIIQPERNIYTTLPQNRKFMDILPPSRKVVAAFSQTAEEIAEDVTEAIEKPSQPQRSMDMLTS